MDLSIYSGRSDRSDFNTINENQEQEEKYFEIIWRQMNYTATNSKWTRLINKLQGNEETPQSKTILENVSGSVKRGEFVAFMGPSGAGKSTLMECIVGRRIKGRTGDAYIIGDNLQIINVAFIAQFNTFLTNLTVRETILFSTKLHIATKTINGSLFEDGKVIVTKVGGNEYCRIITERVIAQLNLESCADNRLINCSGGELKRVSIAQELVARPNILVLDEPTSGLDSASCLQMIQILKQLCESNLKMTVIVSIHQPSQKILYLFHKLYVLSSQGDIIYENVPTVLIEFLRKFDLECPENYNPADFVIEVASGEHGTIALEKLVKYHRDAHQGCFEVDNCIPLTKINQEMSFPDWRHAWILSHRNTLITIRDPIAFGIRFIAMLIVPLFLTNLFTSEVGIRGGCPPEFNANFEPSQLDYIGDEIENEQITAFNNNGNLIFGILFVLFNSLMPTCLTFPCEMIVFKSEKHNLWYSDKAFFLGKMIAELPLQFMFVLFYWPLQHFLQNQTPVMWRISSVCLVLFLVQVIAQTYGYIFGTVFMYNISASVFVAPTGGVIPFLLLCGLFVKIDNVTPLFRTISFLSYLRFAFEAILVTIYGFNRCGEKAEELKEGREAFSVWFSAMLGIFGNGIETSSFTPNSTDYVNNEAPSEAFVEEMIDTISGDFISERNEVRSLVMNIYSLEDWHLERAIMILLVNVFVLRLISFYLIKLRVRSINY